MSWTGIRSFHRKGSRLARKVLADHIRWTGIRMGKLTLVRCEPQEIMDEVEEQLYRALVQDPFGGMLVVPSGAAKRRAVDRMLKRGIVLLGDPVCTLEEMANNIFEDCCVGEISIGVEEAELIVKSVMDENRSSLSEFEPLWAGIGPTVSELRALFDTWRQFTVPPSVISSPGGNSVNDHILSIFEKYLDRTARSKLYDSVGVMECAIRWLKENRVSLKKVWMVGLNELNPLQRELVKAVRSAAGGMEFIVRNDSGKTFSEDLSWLEADEILVKECPKAEELTRFRHAYGSQGQGVRRPAHGSEVGGRGGQKADLIRNQCRRRSASCCR